MQTEVGEKIIDEYNLTDNIKSIILIKKGITYFKSDAIIEIAKQINGWPQILKYGFLIPKFLRDGIYNLIAKSRYYLFGKQEACPIPSEDHRKRYIS